MTRVDAEQIETSRSEKLLAVVLTVFVLIGALWAYFEIDEIAKPDRPGGVHPRQAIEADDREAIASHADANRARRDAVRERSRAERRLELSREAYRTALDAGEPAAALEASYREAQEGLRGAERRVERANRRVAATKPAANEARRSAQMLRRELAAENLAERRSHDRQTFVLRLAFVLAMLAAGYWTLARLRARRSRYLVAALAWIGATAGLALVMAADYITDYIDVFDTGPLVLSLAGIALTLSALTVLHRYLARRTPGRRVRKGQCPFCGFPASGSTHCEGCGRQVVGACTTCESPRRVGTEHCGVCGAA